MSGLATQIRDLLSADTTLAARLPGGIYASTEITRQGTPAAFDANGELRPCAVVRVSTETQIGPYSSGSRAIVNVYFYQRSGFDQIDLAMLRVFELLHEHKLAGTVWDMRWSDDVTDQEDISLQSSLEISRYQVTRLR